MSAYDELIAEGIAKGEARAIAKGEARGIAKGKAEMIIALLRIGKLNTADIAEAAGVAEAYVFQLKDGQNI